MLAEQQQSTTIDTNTNTYTFPELLDVIIIGAGPCGLGVAARLREETPSAIFTDEEHQRYHWINKHSGRMPLVRAHKKRIRGVKADKWNGNNNRSRASMIMGNNYNDDAENNTSSSSSSSISSIVLDGSGTRWMEKWRGLFKILEIDFLRSPMFFHIDPLDRDGMLAYSQVTGRDHVGKDLWELSGCVGREFSKHKQRKMRKQVKAGARPMPG